MGQQLKLQIDGEVEFVQDPAVPAYIDRIGQDLARNSDVQFPITIKVVKSDRPIAFALPGGFLYVNSGLIVAAGNEAELAGVMAHAIAHVAARHATRLLTRMQFANYTDTPLLQASNGHCNVYAICEQEQRMGRPLAFFSFSRAFELEADYLAVQYMYKAGYEPGALVTFLEKLEAQEGSTRPPRVSTFADHPAPAQRIQQAKKEIAAILPARAGATLNTPEFDEIKARVGTLSAPASPAMPRMANE
jgi:predicted Zn-dependent protease